MPIIGSFGAGSKGGYGRGGKTLIPVNYLVVAGGGGSRCVSDTSGGAGAGGYRASGYGPAPLQGSALELAAGCYTVTVGGGGAKGSPGVSSTFGTITSTGGGTAQCGAAPTGGGSGGAPTGLGNAGGFTPPEGNNAGDNGGGGAGGVGGNRPGPTQGGKGGVGVPNLINCGGTPFSRTIFGGGGAGGADPPGSSPQPNDPGGAPGGGGVGGARGSDASTPGAANSGGGAGGQGANLSGESGGSGFVAVRVPGCFSLSVSPGTNATATHPSGDKIATFTVSGTLTIS
jgi:hypothetical protein